jgi:signal peptidase I
MALLNYAKAVAWSLPIGLAFTDLCASVVQVEGPSMQPTLNPQIRARGARGQQDWILIEKLSYKVLHRYNRGDVAVLW